MRLLVIYKRLCLSGSFFFLFVIAIIFLPTYQILAQEKQPETNPEKPVGQCSLKEYETKEIADATALVGVGLVIVPDIEDNRIIIIGTVDGTPAKDANIYKGDVLIAVNGKTVNATTFDYAVNNLRGYRGTDVVLTIAHNGEQHNIKLTRTKFYIPRGPGCLKR